MECKYCGAELEESLLICPCCGGNLEEDSSADDQEEIVLSEEDGVDEEPVIANGQKKPWQVAVAIGCCFVLVASIVLIMLKSMGYLKAKEVPSGDSSVVEQNGGKDEAIKSGKTVVAQMGDMELTNGELQLFYTQQVYEFVQYYGSILSYVGLDTSKPFSEQICMFDESVTWQQYFVDIAVQTWQRYAILNLLAKEDGVTLPDDEIAILNEIPNDMESAAKQYDFESADAFLKAMYGDNVDMDAYVRYMNVLALRNYYYTLKGDELTPTDAEIDAYFEEHKDDFATSNITKESGPIVDVRHLLVQPEGGEKDESNQTVYTEAAWNRALDEAESLLDEWKNGDATQDSFAALASKYTDDGGSKGNGGLYQNITKTSNYVEPFLTWAVDESRKPGDTGIVKTDFGYHIMYFVTGEPQWVMAARTQFVSERLNEIIEAGIEKWPMTLSKEKIAIYANNIVK